MRTNERFEALFDIRHDFIKHSSNVQTLYIELYLRPRGLLALSVLLFSSIYSYPLFSPDTDDFGFAPASTNIVHPGQLCIAKCRHSIQ